MKENKFTAWVKAHKTEMYIAGGILLTTVGTILFVNNWESIKGVVVRETRTIPTLPLNETSEVSAIPAVESEPILKIVDVKEHRRTLPLGYHPSSAKLAEAEKNGIELAENQTIVSAHPRCYAE